MLGKACKKVTLTTLPPRSVARGIGRDQWSWSIYGSRLNAGSLVYDGVLGHTRKMAVPV